MSVAVNSSQSVVVPGGTVTDAAEVVQSLSDPVYADSVKSPEVCLQAFARLPALWCSRVANLGTATAAALVRLPTDAVVRVPWLDLLR